MIKDPLVYTVILNNQARPICPLCGLPGHTYAEDGQNEADEHIWIWAEDGLLEAADKRE